MWSTADAVDGRWLPPTRGLSGPCGRSGEPTRVGNERLDHDMVGGRLTMSRTKVPSKGGASMQNEPPQYPVLSAARSLLTLLPIPD